MCLSGLVGGEWSLKDPWVTNIAGRGIVMIDSYVTWIRVVENMGIRYISHKFTDSMISV